MNRPPSTVHRQPTMGHRPAFTAHGLRSLLAALFLSSFAIPHSSFAADSPLYIPFQGQVTNQAGTVVADGQYTVIFNLYDQAVGGQPVWSERHVRVGVTRGMVNVFLGSISTLEAVDFSQAKYLGITVDTDNLATTADPEMVPRSVIIPAFHAKNAENLAGHNWSAVFTSADPTVGFLKPERLDAATISAAKIADNAITTTKLADNAVTSAKLADGLIGNAKLADGAISTAKLVQAVAEALVPAGTILPFGGSVAPPGYLLCNGGAYDRVGPHAGLFAAIGTSFGAPDGTRFNVPDLRGQFLRGAMPNLQVTFSGSPGSSNISVPSHPFNRTGMTVRVTSPLTGLSAGTDYYVIVVDANQIAFASTRANALAGVKITISGTATGMVVTQAEDPDVISRLAMAGGGTGVGILVGSTQRDELRSHDHFVADGRGRTSENGPNQPWHGNNVGEYRTGFTGGNETRPKNVYVNYIIKY